MEKSFIITIDTEGDNIWGWRYGDNISTENSLFLGRFQKLCDKYGFKPVYLTNYEMVMDSRFTLFAKKASRENRCEIGMHLHAYNTPPFYDIGAYYPNNFPFITEYPEEVITEKIHTMTKVLSSVFETDIISHRAGRWSINDIYLRQLKKSGYLIDCSATPTIDWSNTVGLSKGSCGTNYINCPQETHYMDNNLLEVPVTVRKIRKSFIDNPKTAMDYARMIKRNIYGQTLWLRPNGKNLSEMEFLIEMEKNNNNIDYIMFMLHSSELMPSGSPTFKTKECIDKLYEDMECIFKKISEFCVGRTLREYLMLRGEE